MSLSIGLSKAKRSLIDDAMFLASMYSDQNVFYVDQMAKAFLVICKVISHN